MNEKGQRVGSSGETGRGRVSYDVAACTILTSASLPNRHVPMCTDLEEDGRVVLLRILSGLAVITYTESKKADLP